jgi:hypothetical protein
MSARDEFNSCIQFIVCYSIVPTINIYIETFTYIIDSNNIKLKCIKIISLVSL